MRAWLRRGLISSGGLALLQKGFPRQSLSRRVTWGRPPRADFAPLPETVRECGYNLLVIPTPGHSTDHVCFYEPGRRWLFTGDLFISRQIKYLWKDEDLDRIIASLVRLTELRVETLFCAHRGIVDDGTYFLREKLSYILELRDTVRGLAGRGMSIGEIQKKLRFNDRWIRWFAFGDFSAKNLITALLSSTKTVPDSPSAP